MGIRGAISHSQIPVRVTELEIRTAIIHETMVAPSLSSSSPGKNPTIVVYGTTLLHSYTLNNDDGYRMFKLPETFVGDMTFHIHWTKSSDANEATKKVKWQVSYVVVDGTDQDINVSPTVLTVEDTYDDSGTTTRILYRTDSVAISGGVANYYLFLKIETVTPSGTAITSEPALASLDLRYRKYVNK